MKTKTGYSYGWCFTGSLTSNLHIAVKNKTSPYLYSARYNKTLGPTYFGES